jgi:urea transporter
MDRTKLRHGHFAANSVLIGTSLVDYFTFAEQKHFGGGWPIQVFLSILLAPIALLVTLWLQQKVLSSSTTNTTPVLLLPFNVIMIVVLLSAKVWDATMITPLQQQHATTTEEDATIHERYFGYQAVLNGIARIFLVDGVATGAIILIGIFFCSRILALAVVGGTFFASLLSLAVFDIPSTYLNSGFIGFNPALTVAGIFFYLVPSWKLTGLAFFWLLLTMIATGAVDVLLNAMYVYTHLYIFIHTYSDKTLGNCRHPIVHCLLGCRLFYWYISLILEFVLYFIFCFF